MQLPAVMFSWMCRNKNGSGRFVANYPSLTKSFDGRMDIPMEADSANACINAGMKSEDGV